jgi:hypothetical protein
MTYPPGSGQNPQQPQYPQYPQYPPYGPGPYGGQPHYQAPYAPPPKKKNLAVWIGVPAALVVVLAVGIGLSVAFWPGGPTSGGKPALTGRAQSDYIALLPKQEDFGSDWTVGDDPAPNPTGDDAVQNTLQKKFLSQLTATPSGCGLAELAEKSQSMSDKNHKLAAVTGTLRGGEDQGVGQHEPPAQINVSISDGANYDTAVQTLRDYIAKCSSATMQGSVAQGGAEVSVTMKIDITEIKPPSGQSDKSFGVQMKSTTSFNVGGEDMHMQLSQQVYAASLRGLVVSATTNNPGQAPLLDTLFAATIDRANKA